MNQNHVLNTRWGRVSSSALLAGFFLLFIASLGHSLLIFSHQQRLLSLERSVSKFREQQSPLQSKSRHQSGERGQPTPSVPTATSEWTPNASGSAGGDAPALRPDPIRSFPTLCQSNRDRALAGSLRELANSTYYLKHEDLKQTAFRPHSRFNAIAFPMNGKNNRTFLEISLHFIWEFLILNKDKLS